MKPIKLVTTRLLEILGDEWVKAETGYPGCIVKLNDDGSYYRIIVEKPSDICSVNIELAVFTKRDDNPNFPARRIDLQDFSAEPELFTYTNSNSFNQMLSYIAKEISAHCNSWLENPEYKTDSIINKERLINIQLFEMHKNEARAAFKDKNYVECINLYEKARVIDTISGLDAKYFKMSSKFLKNS